MMVDRWKDDEIKIRPGLWRLADGREIVVTAKDRTEWAFVGVKGGLAGWKPESDFESCKYLGPAVIGATAKDVLATLPPPIDYSVDDDGIECWRFDTVTVFRREGREAVTRSIRGHWTAVCDQEYRNLDMDRTQAEKWCIEQLRPWKPKWRAAKTDGSDNGKACRVRDSETDPWLDDQLLAAYSDVTAYPWLIILRKCSHDVLTWKFCEVPD
jgi:hypothetical protein